MHGVNSLPDVISLPDDKSSILPNIVHVCLKYAVVMYSFDCIYEGPHTKPYTFCTIFESIWLEYAYLTFAPSCFD